MMRGAVLGLVVGMTLGGCATAGPTAPEHRVGNDLAPPPASKTASASDLEEGLRLYSQKRYAEAAEAFEAAYKRGGSAPALFAKGQSLQMAGDCARAMEAFEQLLAVEPDPTYARVVRELMETC
ncbi:MAG: tetratricopeptide repeat protein [Myxococcota bacterium]